MVGPMTLPAMGMIDTRFCNMKTLVILGWPTHHDQVALGAIGDSESLQAFGLFDFSVELCAFE